MFDEILSDGDCNRRSIRERKLFFTDPGFHR